MPAGSARSGWSVPPGCSGYVVVSGPPASGKTTLAAALRDELGLPLIAKDTIKEALMDILDVPDLAASRRIGQASVRVLYAVAREIRPAILESAWRRSYSRSELLALSAPIVEVFCRCSRDGVERRYRARATSRAAGHFDTERDIAELWNDETAQPVAGGWPVIEVDTEKAVEVAALATAIRSAG
ncbi:MAG: hypothetical protein DLM56_12850 [Pseudonocardiales bacterium]|nr:MAG: hypothetical protein DLM56_12850 [Pseudonocardiales bacterium]